MIFFFHIHQRPIFLMQVTPHVAWNNLSHRLLFLGALIGPVLVYIHFLISGSDILYMDILVWILVELFLAAVVIIHLLEATLLVALSLQAHRPDVTEQIEYLFPQTQCSMQHNIDVC